MFEYCMVDMQFVLSVDVLGLLNPLLCKVKLTLSVLLVIFKLLNQLLSLNVGGAVAPKICTRISILSVEKTLSSSKNAPLKLDT